MSSSDVVLLMLLLVSLVVALVVDFLYHRENVCDCPYCWYGRRERRRRAQRGASAHKPVADPRHDVPRDGGWGW